MASNSYNITAKVITPQPALPDVVLTLDGQSAQVLRTIVGSISGTGEGRAVVDKVYGALVNAGVQPAPDVRFFSGSLRG